MLSKEQVKEKVGRAAARLVSEGMNIGAGTGSTAYWFIMALGERVAAGLQCQAVPTSRQTRELLISRQIPVIELNEVDTLDLVVDGADELDHQLQLIKGGGGALLQEKMVAYAARQYVIIADEDKLVNQLGRFPLPVEVIPFGYRQVKRAVEQAYNCQATLRLKNGQPFLTDNQNYILDLGMQEITNPGQVQAFLNNIPGVVENGLFLGMAQEALIGKSNGEIIHLKIKTP